MRVQGSSETLEGCEEQRHVSVPVQLSSHLLQAQRLASQQFLGRTCSAWLQAALALDPSQSFGNS